MKLLFKAISREKASKLPWDIPLSKLPEKLIMTGYMGTGKSTVGRALAQRIDYSWLDTDKTLIRQFNKPIRKIFADDGEPAFRQAELDLLDKLDDGTPQVISTGGGTLVREETWSIAQQLGLIIYLYAPVEVLFERVIFSPKDRPMVEIPDAETVFQERFEARRTFYEQADLIVETDNLTVDAIVDAILEGLPKAMERREFNIIDV